MLFVERHICDIARKEPGRELVLVSLEVRRDDQRKGQGVVSQRIDAPSRSLRARGQRHTLGLNISEMYIGR